MILAGDAHATAQGEVLPADQIIAHHNETLDGLDAGAASLRVLPSADVPLDA